MKINILGFGLSGQAAAKLAKTLGDTVTVYDEGNSPELEKIREKFIKHGVSVQLEWKGVNFAPADLIISSPGIPHNSPLFRTALKSKTPIIGELEFGYRHCHAPLLAVTGTNGKTTTAELTGHILKSLGYKVEIAGNIGEPLSKIAHKYLQKKSLLDFIVTEVSSFQLEEISNQEFTFTPLTAAILNITSDHLDRYANFAEYASTKFRILKNLEFPEKIILNNDLVKIYRETVDSEEVPILFGKYGETGKNAKFTFEIKNDWTIWFKSWNEERLIVNMSESGLSGYHNAENLAASLGLIKAALDKTSWEKSLKNDSYKKVLTRFQPGRHRMEFVGDFKGIKCINDSKATNPAATVAALKELDDSGLKYRYESVLLILGGSDKNMDFSVLKNDLRNVGAVYLYGQCRHKLEKMLKKDITCFSYDNFADAVKDACKNAFPGEYILLSPGCASMDLFKNYQERGDAFRKIVEEYNF